MVKEYLQEKVDAFKTEKERLLQEKECLDGARNRLHESIVEIQENADIDFEIFSPRADMHASKGKLHEMYTQMNDIKKQQVLVTRELESVTAELKKFEIMLEEVKNILP